MSKPLMNSGEDCLWDGFAAQGVPESEIPAKIEEYYLNQALHSDPNGGTCGFCGGTNKNVDDCGFWYLVPLNYKQLKTESKEIKSLPACDACHRGEPGKNHVELFGLGER